MHTDAASLSDFVTLLQSMCLCALAQLWMDRAHALQHVAQKLSKHICGYLYVCVSIYVLHLHGYF